MNENNDELFREAAGNYPLKTDQTGWNDLSARVMDGQDDISNDEEILNDDFIFFRDNFSLLRQIKTLLFRLRKMLWTFAGIVADKKKDKAGCLMMSKFATPARKKLSTLCFCKLCNE